MGLEYFPYMNGLNAADLGIMKLFFSNFGGDFLSFERCGSWRLGGGFLFSPLFGEDSHFD